MFFSITSLFSSSLQLMQQMLYSIKHRNKEGSIDMKWITKSQPALLYSKSTVETSEQCVKFVQGSQKRHQNDINNIALVSLLLTLIVFISDTSIITLSKCMPVGMVSLFIFVLVWTYITPTFAYRLWWCCLGSWVTKWKKQIALLTKIWWEIQPCEKMPVHSQK